MTAKSTSQAVAIPRALTVKELAVPFLLIVPD